MTHLQLPDNLLLFRINLFPVKAAGDFLYPVNTLWFAPHSSVEIDPNIVPSAT